MFHSQLVNGTTIQYKNIGDSAYFITHQDIGKTLRLSQNATVTVGVLNVVDGSMFTLENAASYVITLAGSDGISIEGGTATIPASSSTSFVKTSNTSWKVLSSGSGGGSGSGGTVRQWDLTLISSPAQIMVWPIPAPHTNTIYNPVGVVGDQYNANWIAIPNGYSMELSAVGLATAPFIGNVAFWWKPIAGQSIGGNFHKLQIINTSLVTLFELFVSPTLGLHASTVGFSDYVDSSFVLGDVVLVQISSVGAISIKTANVPTTPISTITLLTGDMIVATCDMHPTNIPVCTGQLAGHDLGSGITTDPSYFAITSQVPAGLPAQSVNGDILQVAVPGTYNGVPFTVNEGAIVMDADNGLVAPMIYQSMIRPMAFLILFLNVGPTHEYNSLHTLNADLINNGIFCNNLYIVYDGTTVEDNLYMSFPSIELVFIIIDNVNNTVTNTNCTMQVVGGRSYGIHLDGTWNVGSLYASYLSMDGTINASAGIINIINFESISTSNVLKSNTRIYITNFRPFSVSTSNNFNCQCDFWCYDEINGVSKEVHLKGITQAGSILLHGCKLKLMGGNHSLSATYYHITETMSNPNCVVEISNMASCNISSISVPNVNGWSDVQYGVLLSRGLAYVEYVSGGLISNYSQTPGTITPNGIIFG